jgi:triosephosphate isomerase
MIAYEPVWAIGTGRAATGDGANTVVRDMIRPALSQMFGEDISQEIRVLYGGSVKASICAEFFEQPEIDGALVGGASLKVSEFVPIVQAASR